MNATLLNNIKKHNNIQIRKFFLILKRKHSSIKWNFTTETHIKRILNYRMTTILGKILCWSFLEVYIFATTYRKAFIVGPKVPYPTPPHPPTHPFPKLKNKIWGGVKSGGGDGDQGECERRSEVFVKKKSFF